MAETVARRIGVEHEPALILSWNFSHITCFLSNGRMVLGDFLCFAKTIRNTAAVPLSTSVPTTYGRPGIRLYPDTEIICQAYDGNGVIYIGAAKRAVLQTDVFASGFMFIWHGRPAKVAADIRYLKLTNKWPATAAPRFRLAKTGTSLVRCD